jgi:hypothetical protein
MKWISSEDLADRAKAAEAYDALTNFKPKPDMSRADWAKGILTAGGTAVDAITGSPSGAILAVGSAIINYVVGLPLSLLHQFEKGDEAMQRFLQANFGDQFNRMDMDLISVNLSFPDSIPDWKRANPQFDVSPGRLDSRNNLPSSTRPCTMIVKNEGMAKRAAKTFDEYWKETEPREG